MKYVSTADISLSDIEIPERLRPVNADWVAALAASFEAQGQKTPIEVVEEGRGRKYRLVAGGHRLGAAEHLGWRAIRAEIKAVESVHPELELELHEIDENLHRNELNPLDRAVFIGRRKQIYEELHPDTKAGVAGGKARQNSATDTMSFAESTAEKIGLGERTIERAARIYSLIGPDLRARLAGTPLATNQGELYSLTRYSPEQQAEIIDRCLTPVRHKDRDVYPSVAQAAAEIDGNAPPLRPAHEIEAAKLRDAWDRGGKRAREAHLKFLTEIGVIDAYTVEHL